MAVKYTKAECQELALQFQTPVQFSKSCRPQYAAAHRNGWLPEITSHMTKKRQGFWTKEQCAKEAAKHNSKAAFKKAEPAGYKVAREANWLKEICAHMKPLRQEWTKELCAVAAQKFQTKKDFEAGDPKAYGIAHRYGWIAEVCTHMQSMRKSWDLENCKQDALKYQNRRAWQQATAGYAVALRNGWLDQCCAHMQDRTPSAQDVIYIWEAVGESYNGKRVFKIGVTSDRIGDYRVHQVAQKAGMEARIVLMRWLGRWNVPDLERYLLTFGEDPKLDVPDGRTEFRALTDEELQVIIKIIESHPIL